MCVLVGFGALYGVKPGKRSVRATGGCRESSGLTEGELVF